MLKKKKKSPCDYIYGTVKYSRIMSISLFQDCLLKITCEKSFLFFFFFSIVANIQRFQGLGLTFWVVIFQTPTVFPLTFKDSHLSHMQKPVTASQHPQSYQFNISSFNPKSYLNIMSSLVPDLTI